MTALPAGIDLVAVRTPTLPPATHTNTWIVGAGALTVVDPASPWEDEQQRLAAHLRARVDSGEHVERIVLTHHHHDHVSGAVALSDAFGGLPIAAHPVTAELLAGRIAVNEPWNDGEARDCGGTVLRAHHTPGHAPGHLVFHDAATATVIAGDMVAGVGTIAIDPREGNLGDYLASLTAMRALGADTLLPAHGPALSPADAILAFYLAHRHGRTDQIRRALDLRGASTPRELVAEVYPDLPAAAAPLAAMQITAHLIWLQEHGLAQPTGRRWALV